NLAMVRGRQPEIDGTGHRDAMRKRIRKDFHYEFTTMRFVPLSEHGQWPELAPSGLDPQSLARACDGRRVRNLDEDPRVDEALGTDIRGEKALRCHRSPPGTWRIRASRC